MTLRNKGFTLVEMSMVLVCVALLAGGVVMAHVMIRNARLVSVTSDIEIYKNATASFRTKYRYLPGDMPNATSIWGADDACPNTPPNAIAKQATCNGNGDSYIGDSNGNAFGGATAWQETYRYWQHLSNAGFIDGNFNGTLSTRKDIGIDLGLNIPASRLLGSGYTMMHVLPGIASGVFNSNYHHVYIFGTPVSAQASTYAAALNPAEARMLDQKVDDGRPDSGFVLSFTNENPLARDCISTSQLDRTLQYNTDIEDVSCSLIFISGM